MLAMNEMAARRRRREAMLQAETKKARKHGSF
jgi:hypothetical protein